MLRSVFAGPPAEPTPKTKKSPAVKKSPKQSATAKGRAKATTKPSGVRRGATGKGTRSVDPFTPKPRQGATFVLFTSC
jgi:hypothetical protein